MATIKSYTDISQSKTLSKILPIESADMWWNFYSVTTDNTTPQIIHIDTPWVGSFNWNNKPDNIPCWSLAALLKIIPKCIGDYNIFRMDINDIDTSMWYDKIGYGVYNKLPDITMEEPINACVEMIVKLHEQKLL